MIDSQRQSYGQPPTQHPAPWPYAPPASLKHRSIRAMAWIVALIVAVAGGVAAIALALSGTSGEMVTGDGYSYELPDGWSDFAETRGTGGHDTVAGAGEGLPDDTAKLSVGVDESQQAPDRPEVEDGIRDLPGVADVEPLDTTIDGVRAIGGRASYVVPETGVEHTVTVYTALYDGRLYSLAYSTEGGVDDHDLATLDTILDSWRWEQA